MENLRKIHFAAFLGVLFTAVFWTAFHATGHAASPERLTLLKARAGKVATRIESATGLKARLRVEPDAQKSAYVLPDGTIVISTGLIECAETDDELAFVLAHEASHILARDYQGGSSPELASAYSELADELSADANALVCMKKAGFRPEASLQILKRVSPENPGLKARADALSALLSSSSF